MHELLHCWFTPHTALHVPLLQVGASSGQVQPVEQSPPDAQRFCSREAEPRILALLQGQSLSIHRMQQKAGGWPAADSCLLPPAPSALRSLPCKPRRYTWAWRRGTYTPWSSRPPHRTCSALGGRRTLKLFTREAGCTGYSACHCTAHSAAAPAALIVQLPARLAAWAPGLTCLSSRPVRPPPWSSCCTSKLRQGRNQAAR